MFYTLAYSSNVVLEVGSPFCLENIMQIMRKQYSLEPPFSAPLKHLDPRLYISQTQTSHWCL